MKKEEQEHKQFLEQQLEWCKKQDRILEEIEMKLHEMKEIAQYALNHELTETEVNHLNIQLNELKSEVHFLEQQLHSVVH
jgi:putative NADPH-quinone reductase